MSVTHDPAPAAGGPRAGERRALVDPRDANFADVFEWQQMSWGELVDYRLYDGIPIADARLLCSGGELARLRAENAKLRAALEPFVRVMGVMTAATASTPKGSQLKAEMESLVNAGVAALAAAPPEPGQ